MHVNQLDLFVRRVGSGPPLLLLHGFFHTGVQWNAYIPDLIEDFELIIPDLRGHGRTNNPSDDFSYALTAKDMLALLDAMEIKTCTGIGYSLGGIALLHMAIEQPSRISAMSIWSSSYILQEQARNVMRALTMSKIEREMTDWLLWLRENHVSDKAQFQSLLAHFQRIANTPNILNLSTEQLGRATAKTLIIHGDSDAYFPVDIPIHLYQTMPNASLMILPNTGHGNIFKRLSEIAVVGMPSTGGGHMPWVIKQFLLEGIS